MRLLTSACMAAATLFTSPALAEDVKVGDKAPEFELKGSDGKAHKLADYTKKGQAVVVAWYPKAFTGG